MVKTVLVTGGAGYIGSHTCKALARAGCLPIAYDNLEYGHRWAARYGPLVEGDLSDTELLRTSIRAHGVEAVLHFAAYTYVGESMTDPQKYFRNNVSGAVSLLEAMRATGIERIVFSSTCATYGEPLRVPITEDEPQKPVNPYGESKYFVERMLSWHAAAYGVQYAALRYFNAAGADPDGELGEEHDPETHLIPRAILAALGRLPELEIFGTDYPTPDGTAVRDYIHVQDLAAAHVAALDYLARGGPSSAFNLGTGKGASVREVIRCIEEVAGKKVPARIAPRRPGDPPELVAAPGKAFKALNWRTAVSDLKTIVETAWRWHEKDDGAAMEPAAQQRPTPK